MQTASKLNYVPMHADAYFKTDIWQEEFKILNFASRDDLRIRKFEMQV